MTDIFKAIREAGNSLFTIFTFFVVISVTRLLIFRAYQGKRRVGGFPGFVLMVILLAGVAITPAGHTKPNTTGDVKYAPTTTDVKCEKKTGVQAMKKSQHGISSQRKKRSCKKKKQQGKNKKESKVKKVVSQE